MKLWPQWIPFHWYKELWIGERRCVLCGKEQARASIFHRWRKITSENDPHAGFYEMHLEKPIKNAIQS